MSLTTMYPAKNNSPATILTAELSSSGSTMTVEDPSVFPAAPNLAVLGSSDDAEIVLYTAISGNVMTIVRGQNGTTPGTWGIGTSAARNFTSQDHEAFRENILDLDTRKANTDDLGALAPLDTVDLASLVTGVLPIENGGTSADTRTGAVRALFNESMLNSASYALVINSGWSKAGYISLQGLRKMSGLGDTTGALPVANGGTGGTDTGWVAVPTQNISEGAIYRRKIGFLCQVVGVGIKLSSECTNYVTVGILPSSYRPNSYNAYSFGCAGTANPMFVNLQSNDGQIRFYKPSYKTSITVNDVCYFSTCFIADEKI